MDRRILINIFSSISFSITPLLTALLLLPIDPAFSTTEDQQKMLRQLEQLDQLDRLDHEEFLSQINRANRCTITRDFNCSERALAAAKKVAGNAKDKATLRLAQVSLADERKVMAKEIEDDHRRKEAFELQMAAEQERAERAEREYQEELRAERKRQEEAEDDADRRRWAQDFQSGLKKLSQDTVRELQQNNSLTLELQRQAQAAADQRRQQQAQENEQRQQRLLAQYEASQQANRRAAEERRAEQQRAQQEAERQRLVNERNREEIARQQRQEEYNRLELERKERSESGPKYEYRDVTLSLGADILRCESTREKALKYSEEVLRNNMHEACDKLGDGWRYHGTAFPDGGAPTGPYGVPFSGYVGYRKCKYLGDGFIATIDGATHVCKRQAARK